MGGWLSQLLEGSFENSELLSSDDPSGRAGRADRPCCIPWRRRLGAIDGLADDFAAMVASARALLHTGTGPNLAENSNDDRRAFASAGATLVDYERSHRADLPKC